MANEIDDNELARRAAAGDRDSYRQLFDKYHRRVVALAFEVLRSHEDARDVAQDAFVKAYVSLKEFKGEANFYTWLYRIAYNLAIDLKRKSTRRGGPSQEFEESARHDGEGFVGHVQGPHAALYQKQQNSLIKRALSGLTEEHCMTIVLREVDGLSYEEIARVTGASLGTVMSRLFYARKKLQKALREIGPVEGQGDDAGTGGDGQGGGGQGGSAAGGGRRGEVRLGVVAPGRKRSTGKFLQRISSCRMSGLLGRVRESIRGVWRKCSEIILNIPEALDVRTAGNSESC